MSQGQVREQHFETDIVEALTQNGAGHTGTKDVSEDYSSGNPIKGYHLRTSKDFDPEYCLIPKDLIDFVQATQPKEWQDFKKQHGSESEKEFFHQIHKRIERKGTLQLFRKGIRLSGCQFRLAYFRPPTHFNPDLRKKYEANFFTVIRQLYFSPDEDNTQSLDLALFLNGLPIFTAELKNPLNGQTVDDAIQQYKLDRDPKEPIFQFKRCLAHFAVDPNEVFMTTHLKKGKTFFLPFNQGKEGGAGNPTKRPDDPGYATDYLWNKIWSTDSVLNLLQYFIHTVQEPEKDPNTGKEKIKEKLIFPRYHQLQTVRRLIKDTRTKGPGNRYLIQHSAGSGKSNTIAWLAHQLSSLHDDQDEHVFETIIVITDRRILDRQLRNTILQFEQTAGVVHAVGDEDTSAELRKALENKKSIITTTLQKFPVVAEQMKAFKGTTFAVLIDEAHSSQAGESTRQMNQVLSVDSLEEAEKSDQEKGPDTEDKINQIIRQRGQLDNVSYFAFTATPKNKTLELFGNKTSDGGYAPFSLYSMRQAIEEGFILDVLENYTTYETYFKLLKKIETDPNYDQKRAMILLRAFTSLHEHAIRKKTEIMVQHFVQYSAHAIKGKAKAMIVTRSRLHAVRFYHAVKKYLKEQGYPYGVLVAFSGTVKDPKTSMESTEARLNGIPDTQTRDAFSGPDYRFLVVANKFQTGFDEPLLHTMYVDKKLGGVNAVQTLSRLNRIHPNKKDTMVLDFANDADDIKKAFDPYYEKTMLSEGTDPNILYTMMDDLEDYHIYESIMVDRFAEAFFSKKVKQDRLYSILEPARDRFKAKTEEEQRDFHTRFLKFVRTYAFLTQIVTFTDPQLEKLYWFGKYLLRIITLKRSSLPIEVLSQVDMDSYRLDKMHSGKVELERGKGKIDPRSDGESHSAGEDKEPLSQIIKVLNDRFGTNFTEDDKVFIQNLQERINADEAIRKSVEVNTPENAKLTFEDKTRSHVRNMIDKNFKFFKKFNDDKDFANAFMSMMYEEYRRGEVGK